MENIEATVGKLPSFYIALSEITKRNYWQLIGDETRLQILVALYIKCKYPKVLFMHPVNEGERTDFMIWIAMNSGLLPGVQDILIFEPKENPGYNGLAIELKVKTKQSLAQIEVEKDLKGCGWMCVVVYKFEEAKSLIDNYLNEKR